MTQADQLNEQTGMGSRLIRLPLVLLLTVGLLFTLLHCATCDLAFASADDATAVMNIDQDSTPDTPELQLPCHHCFSHVTAQQLTTITGPTDLIPVTPSYFREQFPAALAGLPLFKPPRA